MAQVAAHELFLDPIPPELRGQALEAINASNARGFLGLASNTASLLLVSRNRGPLKRRGIYEAALVDAFSATRADNRGWPIRYLVALFEAGDRDKLLAAGDPLPGPSPFTIYRGVAGKRDRKVRSLSWTADRDRACWFAVHLVSFELEDPAVYEAAVTAAEVYAYVSGRDEREFLVRPRRAKRLPLTPEAIWEAAERVEEQNRNAHQNTLDELIKSKGRDDGDK